MMIMVSILHLNDIKGAVNLSNSIELGANYGEPNAPSQFSRNAFGDVLFPMGVASTATLSLPAGQLVTYAFRLALVK